jgi:site-specific recombinase
MTHFRLIKSDSALAKLQEENRKLIRRERRLRKLVAQLEVLLDRELKRQEHEELPAIRF